MSLSSAENLGSSNLVFTYDGAEMSNPVLGTVHNFGTGNYQAMTLTSPATNTVSLNIELSTDNAGTALATGSGFTDVAEISFTLNDETGTADFQWQEATTTKTVVYQDDNATLLAKGTLTNNDMSLDATAPATPGTPDLATASDSGSEDDTAGATSDNLTNDVTPTFEGTAEANATVEVFSSVAGSLGTTTATGGTWSLTSGILAAGTHNITATATDAANNTSAASSALAITIDTTQPTVSVTTTSTDPTNDNPIPVTITFNEEVEDFNENEITITNGTSGDFASADSTTFTINVTPSGDGAITVDVNAAVATDQAGNNNTAASQLGLTYDGTGPTLTNQALAQTASNAMQITYQSNDTGTLYYLVTTNSSTPTQAQIKAGNDQSGTSTNVVSSGNAAVTVTGSDQTIDLSSLTLSSTTYHVFLYQEDALGNEGSIVTNSAAADVTAPTINSSSPADDATGVDPSADITVTFNEDITFGTGFFQLRLTSDDSPVFSIDAANPTATSNKASISGATLTINPGATLSTSTGYYVFILSQTPFLDLAGNAFTGFTASTDLNFVTVVPNSVPSFTIGANQTLSQSAGAQTISSHTSGMTDNDGSTQTLTFNVANNNNGIFDVQPDINEASGNLTFTPKSSTFGKATVTVSLSDDGGTANGGVDQSANQTFDIFITPDNIKINEVHASAGADAEFIEVYNTAGNATSLSGLVMVWFNGNDDLAYKDFDLTGSTSASGFYVIGETAFASKDQDWGATDLQNGPDAVAIYVGSATDFTGASAATTDGLVDVIVYGGSDDAALRTALGNPALQVAGSSTNSISRTPDGTGGFVAQAASPQATNDVTPPTITSVSIPNSAAKVADAITVTIAAGETGLSLTSGSVNGVTVTGFSDDGGGSYSATYTVVEGNTDRAAGDDVPVSFILTDGAGNSNTAFTTAISQASDAIDANSPSVTSVTIPNSSAKVGDAITVSITASEAGLSLNSGSVNGVTVTGFSDDGGGSYSATYTVAEGNTDRAAGDDVPVSFILTDGAGNSNSAFTTAISQASDAIDANSPSVTSVTIPNSSAKVGDAITVSITAGEAGLSLNSGSVNGVAVTGFSDDGGGSYSATYTVAEGNTDRAAGDDVPVSFILTDGAGNSNTAFTTAISQASDAIDANSPSITSVTIPNSAAKVGDAVTVSITAGEAGLSLNSGSVNGVTVTGFSDDGGGSYSATYTVVEGNTDRAAGDNVPVSFILTDGGGNTSATFTTAIAQASDAIDANSPSVTSVTIPNSAAKVGDAITVSITASEAGLSLNSGSVNGVTVTGFSDDGGGSYSATYTVAEGNTDRAAGDDVPVNFILADAAGNTSTAFTTAISQGSDAIDANSPSVTSVTIPNSAAKVGTDILVQIVASEAGLSLNTGTVNGVAVTLFSDHGAGNYTVVYTVVEGNTDRAAGDDVPVSFILTDGGGNNSATFNTAIAQASDAIDANSPSVTSVTIPNASAKVGDAITVSITAGEAGLSLNSGSVNGVTVTGFSDDGGGSYSATYTVVEGNTDRAAGDDVPVSFILTDGGGNTSATFTTAIAQASDAIDANSPSVTSVTIPNSAAKVGDAITVSITASEAGLSLNSGQVNGVFVTGFSDDGGGSYSATYTVVEGNTDRAAGDDVPVSFILIDGAGNTSTTFATAIAQASDAIDANSPLIASVFIPNSASKVGSQILVGILAEPGLTLNSGSVNGVAVTTFSDLGGGNYTAVYTVVAGNTDRAAGDDIPVNFIMTDGAGNNSSAFTTAISQASDPIDASAPTVTSVSIPNSAAKVGDAITVSITASEAGLSLNSGSVNGVTVTGFSDDGGGSYSATYTVVEGNTDRAAGDDVPVSFILTDGGGNNSATFTTAIAQASDAIDANSPTLTSTSPVDDVTDAGISGDITLTFSENIAFGTGNIQILDFDDNTSSVTIDAASPGSQASISGNVLTLSPTNALELNTNYIVQLDATAIDDGAGNSFAGIQDLTSFNFITVNTSVAFSSTSSNGAESTSSANLEVALNAASASTVTVAYAVTGTATGSGTDYTLADGTLTFNPGDVTKNITIASIVADVLDENDETVIVTLSNPTNAGLGTNTQHTYTINDDDATPTVTLSQSNPTFVEAAGTNTITATSSATSGKGDIIVTIAVKAGATTATVTDDYTLSSFTITITQGSTTGTATLTAFQDALDEPNETITVEITGVTNADEDGTQEVASSITDDDATPTVSFNTTSSNGAETTASATLQVDLSAVSGQDVMVDYVVTGTASGSGTDYTLGNGTLNFTAGSSLENITIASIITDGLDEDDETVIVTLSSPTNATLGTNQVHTYTILDVDASPTTGFVTTSSNGDEGTSSATLSVALTGQSGRDITLNYAVTGTATGGGTDYTLADGTFTIEAGLTNKNFTIPGIVDDALDEDDETVIVTLSNPVNAILAGSNAVHTYTINDNDATPTVAFALATDGQSESEPSQDIQVSLNAVSGRTVTVDYAVSGTATAGGADHTTTGGTITFNAGDQDFQQQIVGIVDDLLDEENETIILTLSNPTNATLGTQTTHTYTITDNDDAPTVTLSADNSAIAENGGTSTLTATLSAVSGKDVTVTLGYTGTATNGTDYNSSAGTSIVVTAGTSSNTASPIVTSSDDTTPEGNETIIVDITNVTNGTEATAQTQTITITDDDTPDITFTSAASNGAESVSSAGITVDLSIASLLTVTADYAVTGTATEGTDFTLANGTVTFAPSETQKTITIASIVDDAILEANETVIITLSNLSNANAGTNQVHTYTINNNDAAVVTIADITADENSGTQAITATLSAAVEGGFALDVFTTDGSGTTADSDYSSTGGSTLTFTGTAGETQTLNLGGLGDTKVEANEDFTIRMRNVGFTTVDPNNIDVSSVATYTITNDDAATIAIDDVTKTENADGGGSTTFTFTTTLTGTIDQAFTVDYATSDGSATAGSDYTATSGTLNFAGSTSGETQTFSVTVTHDALVEADEDFTVTLSNLQAGGKALTISDATGTGTITNDDTPDLTFTTASSNGAESVSSAGITVDLNTPSVLTVTADYAVTGTAANGSDFTLADGTVTFNPGSTSETITIASIVDDAILEANETVILTLSNLSNANAGTNQVHTYTINNNDAAAVTIADIAGAENGGNITVTATLDNAVQGGFTVDVSTADGTAEVGDSDYTAVASETLTFAGTAGEMQTFIITPGADTKFENDETLTVGMDNLAATSLSVDISDGATVTINNDDTEPMVTLSVDNNSIAENGGTATLTATLSNLSANDVDVTIGYGGTADNGTDYNNTASTTITVNAGTMSATAAVIITVTDDATAEGDETIIASIDGVTNGTEDGTQSQTITIEDDDAAIITSVTSNTVNGSYKAGDLIEVLVTFNRAVDVTGTPQLTLETGSTDQTANYASGDGTTTLTFNYTVQAGDVNADLDYVDASSLTLNGGTIIGNSLNAILDLPAPGATNSLGDNAAIVIDTTSPVDPVVTIPATSILLNAANQTVTGTHAEDGVIINLYADSDNNGVADNTAVLATTTVSGNAWSFSAGLTGDAANNFVVQAMDAAGNTSAQVDVPTITEDSTSPVITSDGGAATASLNVNENSTAVTTVMATDANAVTFTISGGADQALFSMASGVLTFTTAPDFENPADANTDNAYVVEVTASDGVNADDTQTITVTVADLDDNSPVITSDGGGATAALNVNENSTAVTTVTATDADGVSTVTYSISGGADQALFSMASGVLIFTAAPDFENPGDADTDNAYVVEVTATDGNTTVDTQTITVTVADLDDNSPVITSDGGGATAALNVNENSTAVTTVTATDADGVSTVAYSISGGADQALFSMASGVLTFTAAPDFENPGDADTDNAYVVEVTATDGNTTVDTQTITVTVVDQDDNSPVITSDSGGATAALNVNENSTAVTTVTATDADGVSTVTYSISGGADQALFSMASGVLSFTAAPDFENPGDADTDNVYVVEVTATDGTTTADTQTITVTVTDLNDNNPVITASQALSVDETAANSTSLGNVTATDQDAGTTFSSWAITAGNGAGIFAINAATGELTIADNSNLAARDVTASYTLTLTVSDGTNTSTAETVTVNILDSTAPAAPALVSISDDTGSDGSDFTTNDQTLSFTGTAEANSTVEVLIDGSSIGTTNADASGDFTFDHSATTLAVGSYVITAKATDQSGNTGVLSGSITVTIDTIVPAKPAITRLSDDNGPDNSDNITNDRTLIFYGTAEPLSTIQLKIFGFTFGTGVTDANGDWIVDVSGGNITTGNLTFRAVSIDAAGNTSAVSDDFVTLIDAVAPRINTLTRDDPNPTSASSVEFTAVFSEDVYGLSTSNFELTFTGTQSANIASVSASSGSNITITVNNITGEGSFGLNLHDGSGVTDLAGNLLSNTRVGEVYNTNFSPTDIGLSSTNILENNSIGDVVGNLSTTDVDAGDTHTYTLVSGTGDTDNASFTINGNQLQAAAVFDLETKGSYNIRLQTDDGRGGTFEKAFTITIDNVPEADLRITGNNDIPATPLGITTNFDITVHNDGDATMTITSILYPNAFGGPVSGITIPAASSQVVTMNFTPTIAQLYTGDITIVTNGGTGVLSVSADGAIITGTDDGLLNADAINIYPNPASDVVTVDLSEFNGRPLDIQLFDISGNKTFSVADFKETTLKLDIRTYQQGIYLMYFTDGKSTVQKKFMIRK